MEEDSQYSTTQDEEKHFETEKSSPEPHLPSPDGAAEAKDEEKGDRVEDNERPVQKHGILQLLGESAPCTVSPPPKKKRRKDRESVEHLMVKQNQSSSIQLFDHTKRKTKKMADMLGFLERERNVSLLNDICRSRFGGARKRFKRNDKSCSPKYNPFTYPITAGTVELINDEIDSFITDTTQKHCDVSHLYPNLSICEEAIRCKEDTTNSPDNSNTSTSPHINSTIIGSSLDEYLDRDVETEEEKEAHTGKIDLDDSQEADVCNSSAVKKEFETEEKSVSCDERDEYAVLKLQINDVKGSAWIDPDGCTSDESTLVIDEGSEARGALFGERHLFKRAEKQKKKISHEENKTTALEENQSQLLISQFKFNSEDTDYKMKQSPDHIIVDDCSSDEYEQNSSEVNSSLHQNKLPTHTDENTKNLNNCEKSCNYYFPEITQEEKNCENTFSRPKLLKDSHLMRKMKFKRFNEKEANNYPHVQHVSSTSRKTDRSEVLLPSNSSPGCQLDKEDLIVIVDDNIKDTHEQESPTNHKEKEVNYKFNSPHKVNDTSEHIVSSSNLEYVSSSNQNSTHSQQRSKQQNEFTVLRRRLEGGDHSRRYGPSRDPRRTKNICSRIEADVGKSQKNYRNNKDDSHTLESPFLSGLDFLQQNPLGEFNKVIYVMYRELLTQQSRNVVGQLTEILYLVISESVRYSDRCKKAKRLVSPDFVVREEVMAHRDFQANTIFYGMYFTHLFRNIVQCFPASKAFHTFMYLALFVNLFRRLKSAYNVHSSYLHIARKLVVSMLKANAYEDIIMFSAICKPDTVFETDFLLVSQLIDSFAEYTKTPTEPTCYPNDTTNYFIHSTQWNQDFHLPRTNLTQLPDSNRNVIHPDFPPVRIAVTPSTIHTPLLISKPQTHSVPPQTHSAPHQRIPAAPHTKPRIRDDGHFVNGHIIQQKNQKFFTSEDPRTYTYFSELERRHVGTLRPPFFLVSGVFDPNSAPQLTANFRSATSIPQMATTSTSTTSTKASISASNSATIPPYTSTTASTPSSNTTPRCVPVTTTSTTANSNPVSGNVGKPHARTPTPLPGHQTQQPGVHVWRPTAIRPRFRSIFPTYATGQCLLNSLSLPPPSLERW